MTDEDLSTIQKLWLYGQLIGNTAMHNGNLSFREICGANASSLARLLPASA